MSKRNLYLIITSCAAILVILFSIIFYFQGTKLYSRATMSMAEKLVTDDMKISPTEAARFYAYVSTLYYEILEREKTPGEAVVASALLMDQVYPEDKNKITKFLTGLNLNRDLELNPDTKIFFENFLQQEKTERENKIDYKIIKNPNKWSREKFFGVDILNDKSWILEKSYLATVPPPPKEGSLEQRKAIESLIDTTKHISAEQTAWVNFWSAMHMTPSLAGVWQDRLFTISQSHKLKDAEYAYAQMILAQSLSDTFKETWKVKEKYLTKRPSLYSKEITLSMEDPEYPSYVSEYSSVGYVASEIIIKFFPYRKNILLQDQKVSGEMSQWSGCSFTYDEENGKKLGENILQEILEKKNLQPIRDGSYLPDFLYTLKVRINNFTSLGHVYNWGE